MKRYLTVIIIIVSKLAFSQHVESFGIFGGINIPVTIDQGLRNDPRYVQKFTVRSSPFGFHYGYDGDGYGIIIAPQYLRTGQSFFIRNTVGGEVGSREVLMDFVSLPVAVKVHLADLSFLRVSLVAGVNLQYLVNGRELISHEAAKLRFPSTVVIPSDPGYTEAFDGVFVPEVKDLEYVTNDKFKPFQLFAAMGIRSDYDITEDWSINFDGRINFGIFDPRKTSYINTLKAPDDVPDLFGERRDLHLSATVGISRTIEINKKMRAKRSTRVVGNKQYSIPKRKKPKG